MESWWALRTEIQKKQLDGSAEYLGFFGALLLGFFGALLLSFFGALGLLPPILRNPSDSALAALAVG